MKSFEIEAIPKKEKEKRRLRRLHSIQKNADFVTICDCSKETCDYFNGLKMAKTHCFKKETIVFNKRFWAQQEHACCMQVD